MGNGAAGWGKCWLQFLISCSKIQETHALNMNDLREFFQLLSLGLTPLVLIMSAAVLIIWAPKGWTVFRQRIAGDNMELVDWLVIGICFSFLGKLGDNAWWGVAWHHYEQHQPAAKWWFEYGVVSNSIFRQTCGILAALCHLHVLSSCHRALLLTVGAAIGVVYALVLALT